MKNWQKKRAADRKAQQAYWEEHRYCEVCLAEGRGRVESIETHEIIYKSGGGKCEKDNFLSVCRACHGRCHFLRKPFLERENLWRIKNLDIEKMQEKLRSIRKGRSNELAMDIDRAFISRSRAEYQKEANMLCHLGRD